MRSATSATPTTPRTGDQLKLVAVDNGRGCIRPSEQTVADGTYEPLLRPLFIYVNAAAAARPEVKEFARTARERGSSELPWAVTAP